MKCNTNEKKRMFENLHYHVDFTYKGWEGESKPQSPILSMIIVFENPK
jgi:hypothetical protein